MRTIKFRAFHKGQMTDNVQPNFTDPEFKTCMVPDVNGNFIIEPGGEKGFWYSIKVDAIMQFTGLHDKKGKEIYECDIVKFFTDSHPEGIVRQVEWDEEGMWIPFRDNTFIQDELGDWFIKEKGFEILGNKFSNPELLEKKEKQ